jgi:hypothetical protein
MYCGESRKEIGRTSKRALDGFRRWLAPIRSRLSEADVREIMKRFRSGTPEHKLAAEYGISLNTMKWLLKSGQALAQHLILSLLRNNAILQALAQIY